MIEAAYLLWQVFGPAVAAGLVVVAVLVAGEDNAAH